MTSEADFYKPRKIMLYSILNTILFNKIVDINSTRANYSTEKERQWWFPEAPKKIDENFPRGVIDLGASRFIPFGDDNYMETNLQDDFVSAEVYGQVEIIPVKLSVFIKKMLGYYVNYDESDVQVLIKNKKQADYFGEIIPKILMANEDLLNDAGFSIDGEISVSPAYVDNESLWAIDITFNAQTESLWKKSYSDGNIIRSYTLSETVEQE